MLDMLNHGLAARNANQQSLDSVSRFDPTVVPTTQQIAGLEKTLSDSAKINDGRAWFQEVNSIVLGGILNAVNTLAYNARNVADPTDAIPDPTALSLNGIRRLLWNINPMNEFNYIEGLINPGTAYVNDIINQRMKNDELAEMLTFNIPDHVIVPGALTAISGAANYGQFREWWKKKQDGKESNMAAELFGNIARGSQEIQEYIGPFQGGGEATNYVVNNLSNLAGSVAGNLIFGYGAGALVGKLGSVTRLPNFGVKAINLNKLNNLQRIPGYNNLAKVAITYAQVGGESLMQADQSRETALTNGFKEVGGQEYEDGLNKFIQQKLDETKRMNPDFTPDDFTYRRVIKQATEEYRKQWGAENPDLYSNINEMGDIAYRTVNNVSGLNMLLNYTQSSTFVNAFAKSRNIISKPKFFSKQLGSEMAQEFGEESVTAISDVLAQKAAKGEQVGYEDFISAFFTKGVLEQGAWGALGGGFQTGGFSLLTRKQEIAKYKAQQEQIAKFNEIGNLADRNLLNKVTTLTGSMADVSRQISNIIDLKKQGKDEEAQTEASKLFVNQAYMAFETGTTESLLENYKKLSENTLLTAEEREAATFASNNIKALEKLHSKSQVFSNSNDVYENRARVHMFKEYVKTLNPKLAETQIEFVDLVNSLLGSGKLAGLAGLDAAKVAALKFKPEDLLRNNPYSLDNYMTSALPEGMDKKEVKAIYDTLTEHVSMILGFDNFTNLQKKIKEVQEDIDDLNQKYVDLTSNKTQRSTNFKNQFYATVAEYEGKTAKKALKEGKIKELSDYDPYSDKDYEKFYTTTLNKIKKQLTTTDYEELMADYIGSKKMKNLQDQLAQAQAARDAASPIVPTTATTPTNTTPDTPADPAKEAATNNILATVTPEDKDKEDIQHEVANNIQRDENGDIIAKEDSLFAPRKKTDKLTEAEWQKITENVDAYVNRMEGVSGKTPSFREFIQDFINSTSREITAEVYDVLIEGWKRNAQQNTKYKSEDYEKVFNDLLTDKKGIADQIVNLANQKIYDGDKTETTQDKPPVQEGTATTVDQDGNKVIYDFGEEPVLDFAGSTASYTSFSYKQVYVPVFKEKDGQKVLDYIRIEWVFDPTATDGELFEREQSPFRSSFINAKPLVHPDQYGVGTRLTGKIHPDHKSIQHTRFWTKEQIEKLKQLPQYKDYVGTFEGKKMEYAEGQSPISYGDALNGVTVRYVVPRDNVQDENQTDTVIELFIKIEEGSDEYWDTVPMIIHPEGKDHKEASAFIHSNDWYHASRYTDTESLTAAQKETRSIRKEIREKGSVGLTITQKTTGAFNKCKLPRSEDTFDMISLREANPQGILGITVSNSKGGFNVRNADGKLEPFTNSTRMILNEDKLEVGTSYYLMRAGTEDGRKTYLAVKVLDQKILQSPYADDYIQQTTNNIMWALDIYFNHENPNATESHKRGEEFFKATGYDLTNFEQVKKYISSMIHTVELKEKDTRGTPAQNIEKIKAYGNAYTAIPNGSPYISFINNQINFFFKGTNRVINGTRSLHRNPEMMKQVLDSNMLSKAITTFNVHAPSLEDQGKLYGHFNANGTINHSKTTTYEEHLKDHLFVDIKAVNIGTEENPFYTPFIQPTIGFMRSDAISMTTEEEQKFKKTGVVTEEVKTKIEEKQKENIPLSSTETEIVNQGRVEKPEPNGTPSTPLTQEELDIINQAIADANRLSPEERKNVSLKDITDNNIESLAPKVLTDEQVQKIKDINERIKGLLPHEQDDLVNTMAMFAAETIGYKENSAISEQELYNVLETFVKNHLTPILEGKTKELEQLKKIQETHPELARLSDLIRNKEIYLNKINIILDNTAQLAAEAISKFKRDNAITERVADDNAELVNDEGDNVRSYSKSELEESPRDQATAVIRRFLRGIKMVNDKGEYVEDFLGFVRPANIDKLFDTLKALLADKPADFNTMIEILKRHAGQHPEIYYSVDDNATQGEKERALEINKHTFVGKLLAADKQIQNQFVCVMAQHEMKMKFAMYSYNRKTGRYSLRIWDTNSSNTARVIQNDWNNNINVKMALADPETGEYYVDVDMAKELLDQFDEWNIPAYPMPDVSLEGTAHIANDMKNLGTDIWTRIMKGEQVVVDFTNKESLNVLNANIALQRKAAKEADDYKKVPIGVKSFANPSGFKRTTVNIVPDAVSGKFVISLPKQRRYTKKDLINWLASFGITISEKTINEMDSIGISTGVRGKPIKLNSMFEEGPNKEGVFGLIAYKLREAVKAAENGQKLFIGPTGDIDFNDQVFTRLARVEAKYSEVNNVKSWRDNNKTIYGYTPSKFVTDRVIRLKQVIVQQTKDGEIEVKELIDDLKKAGFSSRSILLQLLDTDAEFREKFFASHIGLTAIKEMGKSSYKDNSITNLSDADHELTKLTGFQDRRQGNLKEYSFSLNGRKVTIPMSMATMFGLTMSDKSAMFMFQTAVFNLNSTSYYKIDFATGEVLGMSDMLKELMYSQIVLPEILRMMDSISRIDPNIDGYRADLFYFLPNLNTMKVKLPSGESTLANYIKNNPQQSVEEIGNIFNNMIYAEIDNVMKNVVTEKLQEWQEQGFIIPKLDDQNQPTGEMETKFLDSQYMKGISTGNQNIRLTIAAYDYCVNYVIHNANMFMVFAGDPALYYKKDKNALATDIDHVESTFVNVGKRMALLNAPGNKLADSESNEYIELCLEDSEIEASDFDEILSVLGEEGAAPYKKTAGTDGQELTTWQEHLYVLEKMGRTPDIIMNITPAEIQRARDIFSDPTIKKADLSERDKEIIKKVLQPIKPVYTGSEYDAQSNTMRTVYIKTSSFPLIPQLTEGLEIDKLRVLMEAMEKRKGMTVRASFKSGVKTGATKEGIKFIDPVTQRFNLPDATDEVLDKIMQTSGLVLKRKNFRIQQDVPFKTAKREEDIVTMGTQMIKLMFGSGVLDISDFEYFGEFNEKGEFVQNDKQHTGKQLLDAYQKLFNKLIVYKKQQLYDELGINMVTNQPYDMARTSKRLQKILKKEAETRGFPQQDIDALEIDSSGNFTIPLWMLSNSDKLEALLNSIVEKRVSKIKFPGNSFVVGSEFGFKVKAESDLSADVKSRIVWINEEARNGLKHNDILIASKFRNNNGEIIDLIKEGYAVKTKDADGKEYWKLDTSKFDEEMLKSLNYRIPTSAHNSMSVDRIAGFLPYENADLMIVSRNKTTQKGIDFDIDKESSYFYWHMVDENGKVVSINNKYSLSTIDREIKDAKDKVRYLKTRGVKDALEGIVESFDEDDDAYDLMSEEEIAELQNAEAIQQTKEAMKEAKSEVAKLKKIKEKLMHNEIIRIQYAVLEHEKVRENIIKVLSTKDAEKQADYIDGLKARDKSKFFALSDSYQKSKVFLGAAGKVAVGAYSLDVVGHSLFQQALASGKALRLMEYDPEVKGHVPYTIRFGNFPSTGVLGNDFTIDGKRKISDVMSERQNIATDNEKLQVMGRVNLNDITIDADKVLNMLGFDLDENGNSISMMFLSQPIIIDYVNELRKLSSNISGFVKDKQDVVIEMLVQKYGGEEEYQHTSENVEIASNLMTHDNLEKQIIDGGSDNFLQQAVLFRFVELLKFGKDLRKIQTTVNVDSKGIGISIFDTIDRVEKIEALYDFKSVYNADALVGEYVPITEPGITAEEMANSGYILLDKYYVRPTTVAGSFSVHTSATAYHMWNRYFPYNSLSFRQVFKEVEEIIGASDESMEGDSTKLSVEDKQEIFKEIKKYFYSSPKFELFGDDAQQERERLFFDIFKKVKKNGKVSMDHEKKSLASYLGELIRNENTPISLKKNSFLRSLTFEVEKNGNPSLIKFNNSSNDYFEPDALYRSFTDLLTLTVDGKPIPLPDFNGEEYNSLKLAQDLIAYAYLEGGVQEVIQFVKFVPMAYLKEMKFAENLRAIHKFFTDLKPGTDSRQEILEFWKMNPFLIDSEKMKNDPKDHVAKYLYSRFTRQFIQHHPEKVMKLTEENIKKDITIIHSKGSTSNVGNIMEFAVPFLTRPAYFAIYDPMLPKGRKKFHLYRYNGQTKTYKKVPVLGIHGLNEYAIRGENNFDSLVNKTVVPIEESEPPQIELVQEMDNTTLSPVTILREFLKTTPVITADNLNILADILEKQVMTADYAPLIREFAKNVGDRSIILEVGEIKDAEGQRIFGQGIYLDGKITLDKDFIAQETSEEEVIKLFIHELVHGYTREALLKYTSKTLSSDVQVLANAPAHIVRLVEIFKQTRDHYERKHGKGYFDKFKVKEGLTTQQRAAYGGYNLLEFVSEVMSNPAFAKELAQVKYKGSDRSLYQKFMDFIRHSLKYLGLNMDIDSLAFQGILSTFELIESESNGYLYRKNLEHSEAFQRTLDGLVPGDIITFDYYSKTGSTHANGEPSFHVRTVTVTEIGSDGFKAIDSISGIEKNFLFNNIRSILDVDNNNTTTINIWYGNDRHPFSNLAERHFIFDGRKYLSVEHAYQSLKSGEFDQEVYDKYNKEGAGKKIRGTKAAMTSGDYNIVLMTSIVYESFKQNPALANQLILTGNARFSQKQDTSIWRAEFPKILAEVRAKLQRNTLTPEVTVVNDETVTINSLRISFPKPFFMLMEGEWTQGEIQALKKDMSTMTEEEILEQYAEVLHKEYRSAIRVLKSYKESNNPMVKALNSINENMLVNKELLIDVLATIINNRTLSDIALINRLKDKYGDVVLFNEEEIRDVKNFIEQFYNTPAPNQLSLFDQLQEDQYHTVKIDQYTVKVYDNGMMKYGNDTIIEDQTLINKVKVLDNYDRNRVVEYNDWLYYVLDGDRIISLRDASEKDESKVKGKEVYINDTPERARILAEYNRKMKLADNDNTQQLIEETDKLINDQKAENDDVILQMRDKPLEYTEGQKEALKRVQRFINSSDRYFLLAGYAGTGKTTIVENIIKYANSAQYGALVVAPTNKAVNVLNSKLQHVVVSTATIHKMLYGEPDEHGDWIPSKMANNAIYIIDESSMIDDKVLNDLLTLLEQTEDSKIIFIGDGFQLEPVGKDPQLFSWNKSNNSFKNENSFQLTEVRRQNDGTILDVATNIRTINRAVIPSQSTEDFQITNKQDMVNQWGKDIIDNNDVVMIVATNKDRISYNNMARDIKYGTDAKMKSLLPQEKLIAVNNTANAANGEQFSLIGDVDLNHFDTFTMDVNYGTQQYPNIVTTTFYIGSVNTSLGRQRIMFTSGMAAAALHGKQILSSVKFNNQGKNIPDHLFTIVSEKSNKKLFDPNLIVATHGYAITAHKSQGSEWNKVYIDSSGMNSQWNTARWLYTAITRAKNEVITFNNRNVANMPIDQIRGNINNDPIIPGPDDITFGSLSPAVKTDDLFSIDNIEDEIARISNNFVDDSGQEIC